MEKPAHGQRYIKAARRARSRAAAIAAIRAVPVQPGYTWKQMAALLNGQKVPNPMGRVWTKRSLADFVKMHEATTGEAVAPWMDDSGRRRGWENISTARRVFQNNADERRENIAAEIRKLAGSAADYMTAVRMLKDSGCRSATGEWTVEKLGTFVRSYQKATGERLTPRVPLRGTNGGRRARR